METRDDEAQDVSDPVLPGWVLRTPTRQSEVWAFPLLGLVLAAVFVVVGTRASSHPVGVVDTVSGMLVAAGSVWLAITGWSAYREQTHVTAWRAHVARIVAGVGTAAVVAVASLVVGSPSGSVYGMVVGVPMAFRFARDVPRFDRLFVAWASAVTAASCAALVVLGLALPDLPDSIRAVWVGPGALVGTVLTVTAVVDFRRAARTPPD